MYLSDEGKARWKDAIDRNIEFKPFKNLEHLRSYMTEEQINTLNTKLDKRAHFSKFTVQVVVSEPIIKTITSPEVIIAVSNVETSHAVEQAEENFKMAQKQFNTNLNTLLVNTSKTDKEISSGSPDPVITFKPVKVIQSTLQKPVEKMDEAIAVIVDHQGSEHLNSKIQLSIQHAETTNRILVERLGVALPVFSNSTDSTKKEINDYLARLSMCSNKFLEKIKPLFWADKWDKATKQPIPRSTTPDEFLKIREEDKNTFNQLLETYKIEYREVIDGFEAFQETLLPRSRSEPLLDFLTDVLEQVNSLITWTTEAEFTQAKTKEKKHFIKASEQTALKEEITQLRSIGTKIGDLPPLNDSEVKNEP